MSEIQSMDPSVPSRFVCKLCTSEMKGEQVVEHLTGLEHRLKYYKLNWWKWYIKIVRSNENQSSVAEKFARETAKEQRDVEMTVNVILKPASDRNKSDVANNEEKKKEHRYICKTCDMTFTTGLLFSRHISGESHQQKLAADVKGCLKVMKERKPKDTSVKNTIAKNTIFKNTILKNTSIKNASVKDTSVTDTSVTDTSVKNTSVKNTSVKDTSFKNTSVKDTNEVKLSLEGCDPDKEKEAVVENEKKKNDDKAFYCKVCNMTFNDKKHYDDHENEILHKRAVVVHNFKEGTLAKRNQLQEANWAKRAKSTVQPLIDMQANLIIGAEYLIEYQAIDLKVKPRYFCSLCNFEMKLPSDVLNHLMKLKHRLRYFKKHEKNMFGTLYNPSCKGKHVHAEQFAMRLATALGPKKLTMKLLRPPFPDKLIDPSLEVLEIKELNTDDSSDEVCTSNKDQPVQSKKRKWKDQLTNPGLDPTAIKLQSIAAQFMGHPSSDYGVVRPLFNVCNIRPPGHNIRPSGHEIRPVVPEVRLTFNNRNIRPRRHDIRPSGHNIRPPSHEIHPVGPNIPPTFKNRNIRPLGHDLRPPGHNIRPSNMGPNNINTWAHNLKMGAASNNPNIVLHSLGITPPFIPLGSNMPPPPAAIGFYPLPPSMNPLPVQSVLHPRNPPPANIPSLMLLPCIPAGSFPAPMLLTQNNPPSKHPPSKIGNKLSAPATLSVKPGVERKTKASVPNVTMSNALRQPGYLGVSTFKGLGESHPTIKTNQSIKSPLPADINKGERIRSSQTSSDRKFNESTAYVKDVDERIKDVDERQVKDVDERQVSKNNDEKLEGDARVDANRSREIRRERNIHEDKRRSKERNKNYSPERKNLDADRSRETRRARNTHEFKRRSKERNKNYSPERKDLDADRRETRWARNMHEDKRRSKERNKNYSPERREHIRKGLSPLRRRYQRDDSPSELIEWKRPRMRSPVSAKSDDDDDVVIIRTSPEKHSREYCAPEKMQYSPKKQISEKERDQYTPSKIHRNYSDQPRDMERYVDPVKPRASDIQPEKEHDSIRESQCYTHSESVLDKDSQYYDDDNSVRRYSQENRNIDSTVDQYYTPSESVPVLDKNSEYYNDGDYSGRRYSQENRDMESTVHQRYNSTHSESVLDKDSQYYDDRRYSQEPRNLDSVSHQNDKEYTGEIREWRQVPQISSAAVRQSSRDREVGITAGTQSSRDKEVVFIAGTQSTRDRELGFTAGMQSTRDREVGFTAGTQSTRDREVGFTAGTQSTRDKGVGFTAGTQSTRDKEVLFTAGTQSTRDRADVFTAGTQSTRDRELGFTAGTQSTRDKEDVFLAGTQSTRENDRAQSSEADALNRKNISRSIDLIKSALAMFNPDNDDDSELCLQISNCLTESLLHYRLVAMAKMGRVDPELSQQLHDLRERNEEQRSGSNSSARQSELAFASPIMHAALCEVRKISTSLTATGDVPLMKQVLAILNVVNEQLYGLLAEGKD